MLQGTTKKHLASNDLTANSEPAPFGSLDPQVGNDIALLREFLANRERHMAGLLGRNTRRSPMRDELLRLITLAFAEGKLHRVAFYTRACSNFATGPSIRSEIDVLVGAELIILTRDRQHHRASLVVPTLRLVHFYNHQMPRLRDEVLSLLKLHSSVDTLAGLADPQVHRRLRLGKTVVRDGVHGREGSIPEW